MLSTLRITEAIIILEVIIMIVKKGRAIESRSIIIFNNNLKLVQIINNKLLLTQFIMEAAVEVVEIKELIKSTQFNIKV